MIGKGIKLFTLFGFEVRIDASWLLLAVLIILTLSTGYFPLHYKDLSTSSYVIMGLIGAIGLFISIILHEMTHSLVARRFGVEMKGITLFMFGGVAQMGEESQTPKGEALMAIAGPIMSFALAGLFYVLHLGLDAAAMPKTITGVVLYLAFINTVLAFFNLIPAFPLDGGRVLRSLLWGWKKNLRWATKIASDIGAGFGLVLIILGVFSLLGGVFIGGLWWCLLGMFLRGISHGSYQQILIREMLAGEPVRRFMHNDPITVSSSLTLEELVNDYVYRHHHKMFPVVDNQSLRGCVSTREVKNISKDEWSTRTVADIATDCSDNNTIAPDADAKDALAIMNKSDNSRLMVVEDGTLRGIVSLKDLLKFLALKLDLEGEDADAQKLQQQLASS